MRFRHVRDGAALRSHGSDLLHCVGVCGRTHVPVRVLSPVVLRRGRAGVLQRIDVQRRARMCRRHLRLRHGYNPLRRGMRERDDRLGQLRRLRARVPVRYDVLGRDLCVSRLRPDVLRLDVRERPDQRVELWHVRAHVRRVANLLGGRVHVRRRAVRVRNELRGDGVGREQLRKLRARVRGESDVHGGRLQVRDWIHDVRRGVREHVDGREQLRRMRERLPRRYRHLFGRHLFVPGAQQRVQWMVRGHEHGSIQLRAVRLSLRDRWHSGDVLLGYLRMRKRADALRDVGLLQHPDRLRELRFMRALVHDGAGLRERALLWSVVHELLRHVRGLEHERRELRRVRARLHSADTLRGRYMRLAGRSPRDSGVVVCRDASGDG